MAECKAVNNCSSVVIICRGAKPWEIFTQQKTWGVPDRVFTGAYCPPGGNAWGNVADETVTDTLRRELSEEAKLGEVHSLMADLVRNYAEPWQARLVPTAQSVLDMATGNTRQGFVTLVSYFTIEVAENTWGELVELSHSHTNLLTEGKGVITSLDKVRESGGRFAYGHDQAMRDFWLLHGLDVSGLVVLPNGAATEVPWQDRYEDIFQTYDVARRPEWHLRLSA
jgi:hypothetical protein